MTVKVRPQDACPRCGEDYVDMLLWSEDGETVRCTTCGMEYQPGEQKERMMAEQTKRTTEELAADGLVWLTDTIRATTHSDRYDRNKYAVLVGLYAVATQLAALRETCEGLPEQLREELGLTIANAGRGV